MPTVLLTQGFRFFFYSNESNEPIHVHVTKGSAEGKIWLEPELAMAYFFGFTSGEQKDIMEIVNEHSEQFKKKWNEHFNK